MQTANHLKELMESFDFPFDVTLASGKMFMVEARRDAWDRFCVCHISELNWKKLNRRWAE